MKDIEVQVKLERVIEWLRGSEDVVYALFLPLAQVQLDSIFFRGSCGDAVNVFWTPNIIQSNLV